MQYRLIFIDVIATIYILELRKYHLELRLDWEKLRTYRSAEKWQTIVDPKQFIMMKSKPDH